jgi:uncharacterized protein YbjT (DUF2867 family)
VSLLLLGPQGKMGEALVARLVAQGDDVRVVETDKEVADRWRTLGARVAQGMVEDPDLVERAAQNCRTIVVCGADGERGTAAVDAALRAAHNTTVDRVILTSASVEPELRAVLRSSEIDYVFLATGRRRSVRRLRPSLLQVAEAIDAADDLAGNPKLELDLSDKHAWAELGLRAPG